MPLSLWKKIPVPLVGERHALIQGSSSELQQMRRVTEFHTGHPLSERGVGLGAPTTAATLRATIVARPPLDLESATSLS